MRKGLLAILFMLFAFAVAAQEDDVDKLHETARTFMRQGDYANASLVLVRALKLNPGNINVAKDLAFDYYLQKENDKAAAVIKPFLDENKGDDQSFQIAGMIYKAMGNFKEADKVFKKGLKIFPKSGPLYNDYGEMLWLFKDNNAIAQWEKGIQQDPSYANNYYNAAKYYANTKDKVWSLIYGEIFINLDSYTARAAEIKNVLLDGYKKLFAEVDVVGDPAGKSAFELAYLNTMNKQNSVVRSGINAESLIMIRTRFILDWSREYAKKFPMELFDLHTELLVKGLFPAYNQWIFGAAQNLAAYQSWINIHSSEYASFNSFQKEHLFKMPAGQYYR